MTQMTDAEEKLLPRDENGKLYFHLIMYDSADGEGPIVLLAIPDFFECESGDTYESNGVLKVPIQTMLEDYLKEFMEQDAGEGVPKFVEWLRDYANRIESANVELTGSRAGLSPVSPESEANEVERRVSRQDNFISSEMLKTALMTPEQQTLVEQMICPKCGVMTLLRKHEDAGMVFTQCSQCMTVWVLTANVM